jgi:hypothetical protein
MLSYVEKAELDIESFQGDRLDLTRLDLRELDIRSFDPPMT